MLARDFLGGVLAVSIGAPAARVDGVGAILSLTKRRGLF